MAPQALDEATARAILLRSRWRLSHQQGDHSEAARLELDPTYQALRRAPLSETLPEDLRERFDAFGRDWERVIAQCGLKAGSWLAEIEMEIDPSRVPEFQRSLEERFASPRIWGALLFMESALPLELSETRWRAIGTFLLSEPMDREALGLETCPGVRTFRILRSVQS